MNRSRSLLGGPRTARSLAEPETVSYLSTYQPSPQKKKAAMRQQGRRGD